MERYIRILGSIVLMIGIFLYVDLPQLMKWDTLTSREQMLFIAFNLVIIGFAMDHGLDPRYQGSAFFAFAAYIAAATYFI